MIFKDPLWLLIFIPLVVLIYFQQKRKMVPTILFSDVSIFYQIEHKYTKYLSKLSI